VTIAKILIPVDLSPRSLEAARYGASLAREFGAGLVFFHALRNGWPLAAREREIQERIRALPGCGRFLLREGPPAQAILQAAETENADLILIPAQPKPALARFLDGSIVAGVLRDARCPVWVGLDKLVPLSRRPIRTILCGLSLGPRAKSVLCWSANLAERFNASLSVIHASKALEAHPGAPGDPEWRYWLKKIARDDIRALQAGLGTSAEVWVESGKPLAAIPSLADHLGADLLVVGKSPRKRVLGDLRTLSYEIACRTPCPVASV